MRTKTILEAIGNTPTVEIKKLNPNPKVKIFAKLEGFNPSGSVKDRIAKYMIEEAEKSGRLTSERILLEPTSGNTGVSLAMVAAIEGYKFTAVMPQNTGLEKKEIIKAYGGDVILSKAEKGTNGAVALARRLVC